MWLFREHCPDYSFSYYLEDAPPGSVRDGLRCENIERLTFADESFDVFITQDVLEHVFHPDRALREISRVLKRGGMHVFTTPKYPSIPKSRRRAQIENGNVVHLLEPEYHGNPISSEGSLVTWTYGADFDGLARQWSGYATSTFVIRDRRRGIDGEHLEVFVTVKDPVNAIGS